MIGKKETGRQLLKRFVITLITSRTECNIRFKNAERGKMIVLFISKKKTAALRNKIDELF